MQIKYILEQSFHYFQTDLARVQEEKEDLGSLEEGVGHSGGRQRCREAVQGQN